MAGNHGAYNQTVGMLVNLSFLRAHRYNRLLEAKPIHFTKGA